MMTLAAARHHIGRPVVFRPFPVTSDDDRHEQGVITAVTDMFVFVRYGTEHRSKATAPDRLTVVQAMTGATGTVNVLDHLTKDRTLPFT